MGEAGAALAALSQQMDFGSVGEGDGEGKDGGTPVGVLRVLRWCEC